MTKTTNYNLNQWEATDRITRADFNADNAAIDSAIKSAANAAATAQSTANSALAAAGSQLIAGGTLSSASLSITIPTSGVNWGDWCAVYLTLSIPGSFGEFILTSSYGNLGDYISSATTRVLFHVAHEAGGNVGGVVMADSGSRMVYLDTSYSNVTYFGFTGRSSFPAGTRWTLYGQK